MSADDFALRNSTVHMRRNRMFLVSEACAKDGIAFDQKASEVLRFSPSVKRIAMQRVRVG